MVRSKMTSAVADLARCTAMMCVKGIRAGHGQVCAHRSSKNLRFVTRDLHAKDVFGLVSSHHRPFGWLPSKEVQR
jgi:hypothetical protein